MSFLKPSQQHFIVEILEMPLSVGNVSGCLLHHDPGGFVLEVPAEETGQKKESSKTFEKRAGNVVIFRLRLPT